MARITFTIAQMRFISAAAEYYITQMDHLTRSLRDRTAFEYLLRDHEIAEKITREIQDCKSVLVTFREPLRSGYDQVSIDGVAPVRMATAHAVCRFLVRAQEEELERRRGDTLTGNALLFNLLLSELDEAKKWIFSSDMIFSDIPDRKMLLNS